MILPTKGVPPSKALIAVGGRILSLLDHNSSPLSVSGLWTQFDSQQSPAQSARISYDWFIMALDLLYALGAIELTSVGLIGRMAS